MEAVRCPECGDVRWSFFGFGPRTTPLSCEICGAAMVAERRRPAGAKAPAAVVERRHAAVAHPGSTGVPPAV